MAGAPDAEGVCPSHPSCFNRYTRKETPNGIARHMSDSLDIILIRGGAVGGGLPNRLSARSTTRVLLLEAGPDTPPGKEPADVLDTYATSYYNDAYFWPGLKVHWRRKENSP